VTPPITGVTDEDDELRWAILVYSEEVQRRLREHVDVGWNDKT